MKFNDNVLPIRKNRIAELRKQNNMKQIDLAKKLDISQGNLSNWETGTYEPDNATLIKLSEIFNCSIDYILNTDASFGVQNPVLQEKNYPSFHGVYFHLAKELEGEDLPEEDIEKIIEYVKFVKSLNKKKE